jgi:hypothetical protein
MAQLRLPSQLTLVVELRRTRRCEPHDEAELEHAIDLAEALQEAVTSPDQDWRQIAALASELARVAEVPEGRG